MIEYKMPEPEVEETRVFLHKNTSQLVCAKHIAIARGLSKSSGMVIFVVDEKDLVGYVIELENDCMLINKKFAERDFIDLGEL